MLKIIGLNILSNILTISTRGEMAFKLVLFLLTFHTLIGQNQYH